MTQQYKQIGNAVPVNLAKEIGYSIVDFLNRYYQSQQKETSKEEVNYKTRRIAI